ncbi:MAG TPA: hypothetical protein ENF94_01835 [Candidatus Woesearchaeota archaeon]|nr:hypothetical protein [Candidatus Woesearchaeota archaeon]
MRFLLLSGGKDSTAALIVCLETGIAFDAVVFVDTQSEFPEIYRHIDSVEKRFRVKVEKLKPEHSPEWFILEKPIEKGIRKGKRGYGFPQLKRRWCVRCLKIEPFKRWSAGRVKEVILGIAYGETNRMANRLFNKFGGFDRKYPLIEHKITEKEALRICYRYGFDFGGLYEIFPRTGCFWCPFQPISSLRNVFFYYPDLWQWMLDVDRKTFNRFKPNYTLEELDKKFLYEMKQKNLFREFLRGGGRK